MRAWLPLVLACWLLAAWAQTPPPAKKAAKRAPVKEQQAHRKATPEQIRKFNELQKKQDAKR